MEPSRLKRGKAFHALVQRDFAENNKSGKAMSEAFMLLREGPRRSTGRADILIDLVTFAAIFELKATDWDLIKPVNVDRNLYRHQRQVFKYIDAQMRTFEEGVSLGILYPEPPKRPGLRRYIENAMSDRYGLPVYWYSELGQ